VFAGPALRLQPDRRLVKLVRSGSEAAFEEIVRRYGSALQRYAGAIVTRQRAEDVTQDAFSKAFIALRDSDKEIKLLPWLYRIVGNTALNELRDSPPQAARLDDRVAGGEDPADTIERRDKVQALFAGLAALPEPQRAAIVMRELEGLSHKQIARSLGISGGAVRQSIHRARTALRDGVGMLLPLPLLRALAMSAGPDAANSAAAGGAGIGLGLAAKAAISTLLVAGAATAGIAIHESRVTDGDHESSSTAIPAGGSGASGTSGPATSGDHGGDSGSGGKGHGGPGHDGTGSGSTDPGSGVPGAQGVTGGGGAGGSGTSGGSGRGVLGPGVGGAVGGAVGGVGGAVGGVGSAVGGAGGAVGGAGGAVGGVGGAVGGVGGAVGGVGGAVGGVGGAVGGGHPLH
jgi:RNA polymerase sigma factor (sigma-70 family)